MRLGPGRVPGTIGGEEHAMDVGATSQQITQALVEPNNDLIGQVVAVIRPERVLA